ncbi:FAD-binding oxidoreductase [Microbacterium sp. KRD172]|uniref:FAD-binding oxidoreductase n=1 Tax=Microbacterium sp. KRD172 TaxID=2729727 RepID=UPI0019D2DDE7|nr:FAD-binding oxidoreductase [Microbacterium sp. KRD172]
MPSIEALASHTIGDLKGIVGDAEVLTDRDALLRPEGVLVRQFEKAFGYEPEFLPLCIVRVYSTGQVAEVMKYCDDHDLSVMLQSGASSSEDQLLVINDKTVVVDMRGMDKLISLDEENMQVTTQGGMGLQELERILNEKGLTTGHWPQSQPLACMGGLVSTRSIGQLSTYYGGIEDMLTGMEAVLPNGEIVRMRSVPRAAAGPDLRHTIMGSEGAWAAITEVTVKIFVDYSKEQWRGAFVMPSFERGLEAIRDIITSGYRPAVVRLYDKADMDAHYGSVELGEDEACMFFVAEAPPEIAQAIGAKIDRVADGFGGRAIGTAVVDNWMDTRNAVNAVLGTEPNRDKYRESRRFNTTIEISASWSDIRKIYRDVLDAVPQHIDNLTMIGGHVSHSYQNGTNIYFVYQLAIEDGDPLKMWESDRAVKDVVATQVLKQPSGGMVHHHGVGKMRVARIADELGSAFPILVGLKKLFDPKNTMNPGTLIPEDALEA